MAADLRQTLHLRASKSQRISIGLSSAQPAARISFRKHSKNLIPAPTVPVESRIDVYRNDQRDFLERASIRR
jgi:hypothetical protein